MPQDNNRLPGCDPAISRGDGERLDRSWVGRLALAAMVALASGPAAAHAQAVPCSVSGGFPCGYQIRDVVIQPAPNLLKFQARVSQARLPVNAGLFAKIFANVKRGPETLCTEEFRDVRITSSTINLEIGRNVNCELDQVIAENEELEFQLCIGSAQNCLASVPLGLSPYALKSTFAAVARRAHTADLAAQASFAHRLTADRDLTQTREVGTGYFDFHTPVSAPRLYPNSADFAPYANGGFVLWTPQRESSPTLHIAARSDGRDNTVPLDRLVLAAETTQTLGRLVVRSGAVKVTGDSDIAGATTVFGPLAAGAAIGGGPSGLDVAGNGTLSGRLSVVGPAVVSGSLRSSNAVAVATGGLHVQGDSTVTGPLSVSAAMTVGSGGASIGGAVQVGGSATVNGDLDVAGSFVGSSVSGTLLTAQTLSITGNGVIEGSLSVTGQVGPIGRAHLAGVPAGFTVPGSLTVGGTRGQALTLSNTVNYSGTSARPGTSATIGGEVNVTGASDSGLLRLSAGGATNAARKSVIDISGPSSNSALSSAISMVTGGVEALRVQGSDVVITGDLLITGNLTTNGGVAGGGTRPTYFMQTSCTLLNPLYTGWRNSSQHLWGVTQCVCPAGYRVVSGGGLGTSGFSSYVSDTTVPVMLGWYQDGTALLLSAKDPSVANAWMVNCVSDGATNGNNASDEMQCAAAFALCVND